MSFLKYSPLTLKTLLMVLLTSVLAFAVVTTIGVLHEHKRLMQEAHEAAERSVRQQVGAISANLWQFDTQALEIILHGMTQSGPIVRGEIFADGIIVTHVERPAYPFTIDVTKNIDLVGPDGKRKIGELRISESYDYVRKHLSNEVLNLATWQLFRTTSLAAILFVIVYRLITRHLSTLAQQVERMRASDTEVSITLTRHSRFRDELDALVDALNRFHHERNLEVRKRAHAESTLRERVTEIETMLGALTDGVIALDCHSHIIYANHAACHLIGGTSEQLDGSDYNNHFSVIEEATGVAQPRFLEAALESGYPTQSRGKFRLRGAKNIEFIAEINVVPMFDAGDVAQIFVFRDISKEIGKERQIEYQAFHDPLTGLGNRSLLTRDLTQQIEQAKLTKQRIALLFIDIDNFKDINDTLGHSLGDMLLQQLASRLRTAVQAPYWVTRHGGDEFIIVIPSLTSEHQATDLAIEVMSHIRISFAIEGYELYVTSSVGISILPDHGSTLGELVSKADMAMYAAKKAGRNTYSIFNDKQLKDTSHRLSIENGLRVALAEQEFTLAYQPKVEIATGCIDSVEVLLRWTSKSLGSISPQNFIPIAEETGLIIEIGEWVLREAVATALRWRELLGRDIVLAINVSTVQFRSPKLLPTLRSLIAAHHDLPRLIEIEVTEGALISDIEDVTAKLTAIKNMGFHIAIDDFGTGYSSLSYLKNLPIDTLKIDQAFIRDLHKSEQDVSIVSAIINLGQSLGFKSVAEGVEEAEHVRILSALKCDYAQGYYFSRPVSEQDAAKFLLQRVVEIENRN